LIDTGAGISSNVTHLNRLADSIVVVTTPEPHAMTDAYALIKVQAEEHGTKSFNLVVNQCRSATEGLKIAERLSEVAMRFLNIRVQFLGHVPADPEVPKSVMQRRAASESSTFTIAGQAWNQIARKVLVEGRPKSAPHGAEDFWRELLWSEPTGRTRVQAGL
jgi:flagellar biosynthesis protein FlhG